MHAYIPKMSLKGPTEISTLSQLEVVPPSPQKVFLKNDCELIQNHPTDVQVHISLHCRRVCKGPGPPALSPFNAHVFNIDLMTATYGPKRRALLMSRLRTLFLSSSFVPPVQDDAAPRIARSR